MPSTASLAQDLVNFYANGTFTFRVGEKNYFVSPVVLITPGVGLLVWNIIGAAAPAAPATGTNVATNGESNHRNIYILQHPIWLPSVQNFRGVIDMAASFTTSASLSIWMYIEGELFREIQ